MSSAVQPDLIDEANRLMGEFSERGLEVRLLGGIAIRLALADRYPPALKRDHDDIDLITTRSQGSDVEAALTELGWQPDQQFNAINGARRLLFDDPATGHKIDGFVEHFEMCHTLPLASRFDQCTETLSPADLLLTKLQVIELNAKDRGDCYALLLGFPVVQGSKPKTIDAAWIAELAASDWGLHHTLELNFDRLVEGLDELGFSQAERTTIEGSIAEIKATMDSAKKSRAWKLRDRIGERKRWYDEPEEIG